MSNLQWFNVANTYLKYRKYKSQFEYSYEIYMRDINAFFNNAISHVNFPIEHIENKINPTLRFVTMEEIPPKMMLDFCNEFGFYAPTVKYDDLGFRYYSFVKKVNWDLLKNGDE